VERRALPRPTNSITDGKTMMAYVPGVAHNVYEGCGFDEACNFVP
jgi:hypothetical protein